MAKGKSRKPPPSPRRLFFPQVTEGAGEVRLTGEARHYLLRVLRMEPGDRLILFDGSGWEHTCVLTAVNPKSVKVRIQGKEKGERESPIQCLLGVGLLKAQKMDLVIQKAVELGVHEVFPVAARRSVKVLDPARAAARKKRWEKIAQEASRQCGRSHVPDIHTVTTLEAFTDMAANADLSLLFTAQATGRFEGPCGQASGYPRRILALTGPEGGFSQEEEQRAKEKGFIPAGLGPRILRAETAAILAVGLVQYCFGDLREGKA